MIDTKAQELKFLIRHNKKGYAAGAAAVAAALAASIYLGKFYTGWIGVPLTEDLFFIDRGRYLADTWIRQGDDYMYADGNAQMSRGIMTIGDDIYAFGPDGKMITGWLETEKGLMHLRGSGRASRGWSMVDGAVYYFDREGIRQTGWLQLADGKYYLEEDGTRVTGWKEIDHKRYYFDENGAMQTGWINIADEWYLMADSGEMLTGDQSEGSKFYHLNEDGTRYTGWYDTEDGKRYYRKTGEAAQGWYEIDGERYYFSEDFIMQTGFVRIDGEIFFLEDDGTVEEGWHEAFREAEDENPDEDTEGEDTEGEEPEEGVTTEGEDTVDEEPEDEGPDPDEYGYEDFYVLDDGCVLDFDGEAGDFGRLLIRKAGIDVAVYTAESREEYQPIVDKENSAVAVKERRDVEYVIADRRSQGFDLKDIEEGDSAYLLRGRTEIMKYVCTRVCIGTNSGEDVVDDKGASVFRQNEDGLCTYSSAGQSDPAKVIVAFWEQKEDAE